MREKQSLYAHKAVHSINSFGYCTTIFLSDEDSITDGKPDENVYSTAGTDNHRNHKNYTLTEYICRQIVKERNDDA